MSGRQRVFWTGNRGFGDAFCLCAAGHLYSKIAGNPTLISFWSAFAGLADYFDGVIYVPPETPNACDLSESQRTKYDMVDVHAEALPPHKFNQVSWQLSKMSGEIQDADIEMNVGRCPLRNAVSVIVVGHTNGTLPPRTMRMMLERARGFYPRHQFQLVGHRHSVSAEHQAILDSFGVLDQRSDDDKTVHQIIGQLRKSDLLIAPHTGPVFPALGLGLRVWCPSSKFPHWNFWLEFPSNRPFWWDCTAGDFKIVVGGQFQR